MGVLKGETVTVIRHEDGAADELGAPALAERREEVANVLVVPSGTAGLADDTRPHATRAAIKLAFPRPYDASLRGAEIELHGQRYAVVGDPQPCRENCPTSWWMNVEAVRHEG